jgi:hypothetical protein
LLKCKGKAAGGKFKIKLLADSPKWRNGFDRGFRWRDADGCGRDDCAPEEVANDSGKEIATRG